MLLAIMCKITFYAVLASFKALPRCCQFPFFSSQLSPYAQPLPLSDSHTLDHYALALIVPVLGTKHLQAASMFQSLQIIQISRSIGSPQKPS